MKSQWDKPTTVDEAAMRGYDPCGDHHDWYDRGDGIYKCRWCSMTSDVFFGRGGGGTRGVAQVTHLDPAAETLTPTVYPAADEVLLGVAELKRLREVKQLAKELANWIESRMIDVGGAAVFYCLVCDSGVSGQAVTRNDIVHHGDCLIARARKLGLLE